MTGEIVEFPPIPAGGVFSCCAGKAPPDVLLPGTPNGVAPDAGPHILFFSLNDIFLSIKRLNTQIFVPIRL